MLKAIEGGARIKAETVGRPAWTCLDCGENDWKVLSSYVTNRGHRRRQRECRKCGFRMTTQELPVGEGESVVAATPRVRVQVRMLDLLDRRPESHNWTVREWALALGCGKSTVQATKIWEQLEGVRAENRKTQMAKAVRPRDV